MVGGRSWPFGQRSRRAGTRMLHDSHCHTTTHRRRVTPTKRSSLFSSRNLERAHHIAGENIGVVEGIQVDPDHRHAAVAEVEKMVGADVPVFPFDVCLLYTSDAADERSSVDLGGRRIIKKKKHRKHYTQHRIKTSTDTDHTEKERKHNAESEK